MTARYVPVSDLRSYQARAIATLAHAHGWHVDCCVEPPWSGEPDTVDESVVASIAADGAVYMAFGFWNAVDREGTPGVFTWRLRSNTPDGQFISATSSSVWVHELEQALRDLGVINLRDVA